jgi:type II secretory pathway pseudopilin PulG
MINTKLAAPGKTSAQSGITLMEALAALAIGSIVTAGVVGLVNESLDDTKAQQAALYQSRISEAAAAYIRKEYQTLLGQTVPKAVKLQDLKDKEVLDASFSATNPYGQTPCLLIRTVNSQVQAMLVTEGGDPVPAKQLAYAASLSQNGGSITAPGGVLTASGAFGNWTIPVSAFGTTKCTGTAAGADHLATLVSWGASGMSAGMAAGTSEFLYRGTLPGNPDANKMTTALDMGGNAINNAASVTTGNLNAASISATSFSTNFLNLGTTAATTCSATRIGAYARDPATNELRWCDGTAWKSGGTFLSRNAVAGDPDANKMSTALNMGGNAINNAGDIVSSGKLQFGAVREGVSCDIPQNMYAQSVDSPNHLLHCAASGTMHIGGENKILQQAAAGANCASNGDYAQNVSRPSELLRCDVWANGGPLQWGLAYFLPPSTFEAQEGDACGSSPIVFAAKRGSAPSSLLACQADAGGGKTYKPATKFVGTWQAASLLPKVAIEAGKYDFRTAYSGVGVDPAAPFYNDGFLVRGRELSCFKDDADPTSRGGCVAWCPAGKIAISGTVYCPDSNRSVAKSEHVTSGSFSGWRGSCFWTDANSDNQKVFAQVVCGSLSY